MQDNESATQQQYQNNLDGHSDVKGAAVRFPPPLIFLILIIVGFGLNYLWPARLGLGVEIRAVGIALALFAAATVILISGTFKRVGTAIEPWKPTTNIVTSGFYAWSRNPIYTGFCFFTIGIGIATNNLWILLSFIPGAALVYFIAIAKEEAYLEKKFGEEYLTYKSKVRRWL